MYHSRLHQLYKYHNHLDFHQTLPGPSSQHKRNVILPSDSITLLLLPSFSLISSTKECKQAYENMYNINVENKSSENVFLSRHLVLSPTHDHLCVMHQVLKHRTCTSAAADACKGKVFQLKGQNTRKMVNFSKTHKIMQIP